MTSLIGSCYAESAQTGDDSIVAAGIRIPPALCNRRFVIRQANYRPTITT